MTQVRCQAAGAPKDVLALGAEAIPAALEWGEVLLSIRAAPVGPAESETRDVLQLLAAGRREHRPGQGA